MKTFTIFGFILILLLNFQNSKGQGVNKQGYELMGKNQETVVLKQVFTKTAEIIPFNSKITSIYGLGVKADITFADDKSRVRIILLDKSDNEYLVYEAYPLLEDKPSFSIDNLCEETGILNAVNPKSLRIEVTDASISVASITYSTAIDAGIDIKKESKDKKQLRNNNKIRQINQSLNARGQAWVAGNTEVSELTYSEKKKLFGQSNFPSGIEFYVGGILQAGDGVILKSAQTSTLIEKWDWRNRHGKSWMTDIRNQGSCGSCWAFASTGATEAQVNLYYNQSLNMNLSEQNLLSCSGAGTCSGGYPSIALDYIKNTGIVNEEAFPYTATDQSCSNKSSSPTDLLKIGGRVDFGSSAWPASEDNLKKMIIKYGPLSGGLLDWSHAMTLVGWQVVNEGDRFYYRDLNKSTYWYTVPAGSALIGKTVWIFKNSWGVWGDAGYVYVETNISNFAWTHGLLMPVQSLKQNYTVQCVDNDGDGFYWWGLGPKPANCPPSPAAEDGNDADATLGPLDNNGNCILLNALPVADFTSNIIILTENSSVNFTDLSANAPTSWSWTFDGGTPASSLEINPVVAYNTAGTYNVTLTVTNSNGSNTLTKSGYITVNQNIPTFCPSHGNASKEWIARVSLNGISFSSKSSGSAGYADFTDKSFNVTANSSYSMSLTPQFNGKANFEGFSVWIDFNHNFDFSDPGELVLSVNNVKSALSKNMTIPANALTGPSRMRVSMKRAALPLPCETFAYGEVEDYTINISAAVSASFLKSAEIGSSIPIQKGSFRIYPNPVDQVLNLKLDQVFDQDEYSIFSVSGVLIRKNLLYSKLTQLDMNGLPAGIFVISVKNGDQNLQTKFIKKQ